MTNYYFNNKPQINIYEKPKRISKISSQLLFGEKFQILGENKKYFKIKTDYDKYVGYIFKKKFLKSYHPKHKVKVLKSRIYKNNNLSSGTNSYLPFSSNLQVLDKKKKFYKFGKSMWLKKNDICKNNKTTRNFKAILKLFRGCKYKWGGKTYEGIDCSGLLQIYYKFNNKFFPRDTKDQIKYKRGLNQKKEFENGDIIFWKGHVAICMNKKTLIHAYGPMKKVILMPINKTVKVIKKTANLEIKKIFSI